MKRSFLIVLACACALAIALFGMTACGGSGDSGSNDGSTNASSDTGAEGEEEASGEYSSDDIRAIFEQAVITMSEFYTGTTPVGETLYYAGGADGENALLVIIVPENSGSVIFIGTATVNEDNTLTVNDETTGGMITFSVTDNEDGTYSFSLGSEYGDTIMHRCSSAEVVDALTEVVMATTAAGADNAGAEGEAGGEAPATE